MSRMFRTASIPSRARLRASILSWEISTPTREVRTMTPAAVAPIAITVTATMVSISDSARIPRIFLFVFIGGYYSRV